jgi:hypothetical protein
MPYKVEIVGYTTETHTNKDDVIIQLATILMAMNETITVTWPDGFSYGVVAEE